MVEPVSYDQNKSALQSHFGFREMPFGVAPDPRFFYSNYLHTEGLDTLAEGIRAKKGLMLVTGEVGTGKTILLRKLMRELEVSTRFIFISTTHLTHGALIEFMVEDLGLLTEGKSRLEIAQAFNRYLLAQNRDGRTVALLIDEAQKLSDEALESLCDLSNLETEREKLLQIILVGQPELVEKLSNPSLQRIKQRIAAHHRTHAFSFKNDAEHYIRHRLQAAGYQGPEIFNKEALEAIWSFSAGTPRLINIICDNALAAACRAGRKKIPAYAIIKVAGNLMLERHSETLKNGASRNGVPSARTASAKITESLHDNDEAKPGRRENDGKSVGFTGNGAASRQTQSRAAAQKPVAPQFFDFMARAATEGLGPMAKLVVDDQISTLGETRDAFPQEKLAQLVQGVSGEILSDSMRIHFQNTMAQAISAIQTLPTL